MPENVHRNLDRGDVEKVTKVSEQQKQQRAKLIRRIIYLSISGLIAVAYLFCLIGGRFLLTDKESEIFKYYQSLDIFAATNPVPFMRLVSYALLVYTIGFVIRFIIDQVVKFKKNKKQHGIALLEMVGNLVKYVTYIIFACLILSAFGIDAATIFAGLGIVTLIIGLGVTSLIEDIVAGIFIIVEHLFDVGDIIVLDGFRGTVVSIGIRSTKIADVGNDVLTVRNSSIGALINLTDNQSSAAVTIPVPPTESIERIEKIIKEANIGSYAKLNPNIIGEPIYLGICDISPKGVQSLLFVAGCKEENKYEVQRVLYHELKLLFESHGIKLGVQGLYDSAEQGE